MLRDTVRDTDTIHDTAFTGNGRIFRILSSIPVLQIRIGSFDRIKRIVQGIGIRLHRRETHMGQYVL